MKENKINEEKIRRKLRKRLLLGTIAGVVLFLYGVIRLCFFEPNTGVNIKRLQPTVINGTIPLILGILLIFGCYLSFKKFNKIIEQEIKDMENEKKEKRNQPKYLKHY